MPTLLPCWPAWRTFAIEAYERLATSKGTSGRSEPTAIV
jgi:hypothetical protein